MEIREFSKVFDGLPQWLEENKAMALEGRFIDDGMFSWNMSYRNAGPFNHFIEDITTFDLGLAEGQVVKHLSSLGCRMIFIGTFAGNVVIHERTRHTDPSHEGTPENAPIIVACYTPKVLEPIVGNKPLRQSDLYRLTGFFNVTENIGYTLKRIRALSASEEVA